MIRLVQRLSPFTERNLLNQVFPGAEQDQIEQILRRGPTPVPEDPRRAPDARHARLAAPPLQSRVDKRGVDRTSAKRHAKEGGR